MSFKRQIRIIISFSLLLFSCKNKVEVNIPFNFHQNGSSNIDFKIDTISKKKVYNIYLSKAYFISMKEKLIGFTKEIHEKPYINYNLIRKAINIPKTEEINANYSFYAVVQVNESTFKKIPIKLSGFTMIDFEYPIKEN
ncbi:hypothetical protein [Pedobacter cryophilus]|uniref:Lipoprotein n=1 Tax=Pedobacter cryophilus TaxID=2571271 RepID=A0A4U1BWQ9_9SPHI|nr:hypothetical protein [Pedobacter cryophilus]TKB95540.1 hypothetical protein FA046_16195 [Pedobacter cryophilus]